MEVSSRLVLASAASKDAVCMKGSKAGKGESRSPAHSDLIFFTQYSKKATECNDARTVDDDIVELASCNPRQECTSSLLLKFKLILHWVVP